MGATKTSGVCRRTRADERPRDARRDRRDGDVDATLGRASRARRRRSRSRAGRGCRGGAAGTRRAARAGSSGRPSPRRRSTIVPVQRFAAAARDRRCSRSQRSSVSRACAAKRASLRASGARCADRARGAASRLRARGAGSARDSVDGLTWHSRLVRRKCRVRERCRKRPQGVVVHRSPLVLQNRNTELKQFILRNDAAIRYPEARRFFDCPGEVMADAARVLVEDFQDRHRQDGRSHRADRQGWPPPLPAAAEGLRRRQADRRHRLGLAGAGAGAEPARLAGGHRASR